MMQQAPPVLAGRYELGPVLGSGGMATVYRARDLELGRDVAVKILAEHLRSDRGFVERFRREAQTAARLEHPNLVTVFDTGVDGDTPYLVMELVQGETLAERLRRTGPLDADEAIEVAVGVCRALEAAHEHGLVHRDVKPGNVMLGRDGRVRLVDLGIARVGGLDGLTTTGTVMGSSAYLSPEQASGGPGEPRSDVYAVGCVLFEMLTGRPPFVADSPVATLFLHVHDEAPAPSTLAAVPGALDEIVLRCLEKDPARRFASARELETALVQVAREEGTLPLPVAGAFDETVPIEARVPRDERPARRYGPGAIAAIVVAFLLVAAVAVALTSDPIRAREIRRAALEAAPTDAAPIEVASAWAGLIDAIAGQVLSGGIDEATGQELADRALAVLDAVEARDPARTAEALTSFQDAVDAGVGRGTISPDASAAVDLATAELVAALEDQGMLELEEPVPADPAVTDDGSTEEEVDDPGGGNGHGPPPHAEANGHEDD